MTHPRCSCQLHGILALSLVVLTGCSDARVKKTAELRTGITMKYVEAGKTDGEAVILLHGVTDTSRSFYPTIESLVQEDADIHVYALDQRGHGDSSMPQEPDCAAAPEQCFEMADFAADVIAFMDLKNIRQAHIVGHSMSSLVAQELALTSAARVKSMVLIGGLATGVGNPAIRDFLLADTVEGVFQVALEKRPGFRWPQDAYLLTPLDANPNVETWLAKNWVADPTADPKFLREILPETARIRLGTWLGALRSMSKSDNRGRLRELEVPTLVIWATQDNFFPADPDQATLRAALDEAVADCRTGYIFKTYGEKPLPASGLQESDIGHNVQWGAPDMVAADIAAFIHTGEPTKDLPYADPEDVTKLLVDKGGADIVAKRPQASCTPMDTSSVTDPGAGKSGAHK